MKHPIELNTFFEKAFRFFLIENDATYIHSVRRPPDDKDFYQNLEAQIRQHHFLKISRWRKVSEGLIKITRPAEISLNLEDFFTNNPDKRAIYESIFQARSRCQIIDFKSFLTSNFAICVRRHQSLTEAIELFQYLIREEDNIKGLLPRQLQHSFSSKYIGKEPLLLSLLSFFSGESATWETFFERFGLIKRLPEFRFYAPRCSWKDSPLNEFHGVLFKENLHNFSFDGIERTLVVENIESLLPLVGKCSKTLLIWGEGWKSIQLIPLTRQMPKPVYYWGDIDKEGIEIADRFRSEANSHTILMDEDTLAVNNHLIEYIDERKETNRKAVVQLKSIYDRVIADGIRLEQEKIHFNWLIMTK